MTGPQAPPTRQLRNKLVRNGYRPVPLYGKEPPVYGKNNKNGGLAGWQTLEDVTGEQIRIWEKMWPDAVNTGGLTRFTPAIDGDILHPEAAEDFEQFTRGWFERRGKILVRVGLPPKRAILLRTDEPFAKLVRKFVAPDGSRHKIEILGDGQQLVYDGIHPDTGQPYVWHGGDPSTVKRSELPDTDAAEVERFLDEASSRLIKLFDFKPDDDKKQRARKADGDTPREEKTASKRETAWAAAALQNVAAELGGTENGDRNNKLYKCAFRMGTMIARGWIARDVVELELERAAAACGYEKDDGLKATRATIESGIEGGLDCPHEDLDGGDEINDELVRLAKLSVLDYELARKDAAAQLGMRASVLDQVVQVVRAKLGLDGDDGDGKQGRKVAFPEVEPWPDPVDGAVLLDDIATAIRTYIVMADYEGDISALWAIHTYVIQHFKISPKLSIRSPMRRCGKSTLIEILAEMVHRACPTGSITKAALFRAIELWHPTLLVDEVDTFVGDDRELRGILNQSHRYDGYVMRTVAADDDHEPRRFGVYAAVALSGIGGLAATLADRSVTTNLKRKRPGEKITKFRLKHITHLHDLRRRIVRWVGDHEEHIAEREPEMPEAIVDREADNWEILFAIADEAGGEWPQRARKAALAAHGAETDDDLSLLELLLVDIHTAFAGKAEISSAELVGKLTRMIGHPWREMGKSGKQLTQNKLARMLNGLRLGIAPRMTGPKDKRVSGYELAQFEEAFQRYLPSEGDSNLTTSHQAANTGTSDDSKPHTKGDGCEVGKREKSNNDGLVRGCEVGKGGNAHGDKKGGRRRMIKLPDFEGVPDDDPWARD